MVKEYIRPDGYRIRASEKAYNMLYKKNGFVPVETTAPVEETTTAETAAPVEETTAAEITAPIEEAAKAGKGKGKAAASKFKKAAATESDQEVIPEDETAMGAADQDAAEQPEGE